MTRSKRLLIIARRYWPASDDLSLYLSALVRHLAKLNCQSVVVSPRWHHTWPLRVTVEETPVWRLDPAPTGRLRTSRFSRNLAQLVREQASHFDGIVCGCADESAFELVQLAPRLGIPAFVLFDPNDLRLGESCPDNWSDRLSLALRTCLRASKVIVSNQYAHQQLLSLGVPSQQIIRWSSWNAQPLDFSIQAQFFARKHLWEVNCDLAVGSRDRLLVVPGELTEAWGVDFLIDSVWSLLDADPRLRIWIHGEGPSRDRFYQRLKFHGVHRSVILPGVFSCIESILLAADACIFPRVGCGQSWLLPTCLASGIPILAARSQELMAQLGSAAEDLTFPADDPDGFRRQINGRLQDLDGWRRTAQEAARGIRRRTVGGDPFHDLLAGLGLTADNSASRFPEQDVNSMRLAE
jgi:glycosyltransferase involved in cell wall biosynthesis